MSFNNSSIGFTIQKIICDKFDIIPISSRAVSYFETNYISELYDYFSLMVDKIFNLYKFIPIKCTTLAKDNNNNDVPYNFVLKDDKTLSVRTNSTGSRVAPREVGQPGYDKLNKYFAHIYGRKINDQEDIKRLFLFKIEQILPIMIKHFFDADYLLWIFPTGIDFDYKIINGNTSINIEYKNENFTFTRDLNTWNNSNTLKYKGISIAEIQLFKDRTLIFRFIPSALLKFMI